MKAMQILFPVVFMILLGFLCRISKIITPTQKDGAKDIIFNVVLPIVVFNAVFTSKVDKTTIYIVMYALVAWTIAFLIGYLCRNWISKRYSKIIPYMLWTVEGGSVALPLYSAIVGDGYAFNTIRFDMAGIVVGFVLIPILVAKQSSGEVTTKELFIKIITNRFVQALVAGLVFNIVGLYGVIENSGFLNLYENTISMVSSSLTSLILFAMGYELKLEARTLPPILKLIAIRIVTSAAIAAGIFVLFRDMIADRAFMIAVLVYFSSPTGFANQLQVKPLFEDETDGQFLSTYLSLYMIVTLIAYTMIVTFFA